MSTFTSRRRYFRAKLLNSPMIFGGPPVLRDDEWRVGNAVVKGMPKLGPSERGLILPPQIEIVERGFNMKQNTQPQDFRVATLFWDRIVRPHSDVIMFVYDSPEDCFLQSEGITSSPTVFFPEGLKMSEVIRIFSGPLEAGEASTPGQWSTYCGPGGISVLSSGDDPEKKDVRFRLYRALPVPDRDVPLEDLLAFKAKRADELGTLRHGLHRIYRAIMDDPERDLRERMEFRELTKALKDFSSVSEEWKVPKRLISLSGTLSGKTFEKAAGGYLGAAALGLPGEIGAIAGAAYAQLSLDAAALFRKREAPSPYEYVGNYHNELFV